MSSYASHQPQALTPQGGEDSSTSSGGGVAPIDPQFGKKKP
ncbi:uncharacterized protein PODANS_7_6050 [Podospora anserina S mat+]|uniref:Podospora anserina S mat+ genomic DNA chromosome 7, supercontig 1 n=1 Tax=Podospora anserina (strain S / ATCC MYA-4624 / DSM 980 / FGSC 10383) TaxID=515849 RepID=B2AW60_PODAN|nr:uncharacterized protein PODANS_7_6050 [Podospora anserina S mat+]CAP68634.1 unnamed protein product [Podospora anserina S mat+]CDP32107.1 Putative protein of unknown function [Podospora anserina S mat+]